MMKTLFPFLIIVISLFSCVEKRQIDLIVENGKVYTVDENFSTVSHFAIDKGKIIATGTKEDILSQYNGEKILDASGKTIIPGWIDAHCHFYGLGLMNQRVDLVGAKNFDEILNRLVEFQRSNKHTYILGEGWDQNLWKDKTFPTKIKLDSLYPHTPIALRRIDGHALLVNQAALNLAKITMNTIEEGGRIEKLNGQLTGIIIDKPMQLIFDSQPKPNRATQIKALKAAEKICFRHGLTSITEAGLDREIIELIDSLQQEGDLQIRINAMINYNEQNLSHYLLRPIYKTDKLQVNSFKLYADGSLGSRGACLKEAYADKKGHQGQLISNIETLDSIIAHIANSPYQLNSHAIGDSTNKLMLQLYTKHLKGKLNRRWRIEHAQVVSPSDIPFFSQGILPSVQPTHAISDMGWAEERLGAERIHHAYAYKDLLSANKMIALGTDFPIEKVDPRLTFHSAISRQNIFSEPENGFNMEQALTREETLRGMTIWAAYASFEEMEKGSIEVGKWADFIILDKDIMAIPYHQIPSIQVEATFIAGKQVYGHKKRE